MGDLVPSGASQSAGTEPAAFATEPAAQLRDDHGELDIRLVDNQWKLRMVGYAPFMAGATFERDEKATRRDIYNVAFALSEWLKADEAATQGHAAREEQERQERTAQGALASKLAMAYQLECRREDFIGALQLLMAAQKTGRFLRVSFEDGHLVLTRGATSARAPAIGTWFGTRGLVVGVIRQLWGKRKALPDPVVISVSQNRFSVSHFHDVCVFTEPPPAP